MKAGAIYYNVSIMIALINDALGTV